MRGKIKSNITTGSLGMVTKIHAGIVIVRIFYHNTRESLLVCLPVLQPPLLHPFPLLISLSSDLEVFSPCFPQCCACHSACLGLHFILRTTIDTLGWYLYLCLYFMSVLFGGESIAFNVSKRNHNCLFVSVS